MTRDLGAFLNHYRELYATARRRGLGVMQLVLKAVRKFDREFIPEDATAKDLLTIEESGTLSDEQARVLYKRLSSYFARRGVKTLTAAQKETRSAAGAAKRWAKRKPPG